MVKKAWFSFFCCLIAATLSFANAPGAKLYNAQHFKLSNGLEVYLIENHRVPVVSHTVVYRVGSADDPRGKSGLAHYHEHMMFKGPEGSASAQIMAAVNKVGGAINAATSFDVTYYYAIVPKEYLAMIMKLEAERMGKLEVLPEQAASEREVVLEEENMRIGNNPLAQFFRALSGAFYRHHPYRIDPIGWRHEIEQYTPQDVEAFHERWYAPNNAFVILSGDITLPEAQKLAETYYGVLPAKEIEPRQRVIEPAHDAVIKVTQTSTKINQPTFALVFPAPNYEPQAPEKAQALNLAVYALQNQATGILYRRLVEDRKVAAGLSINYDMYTLNPSDITLVVQPVPGVTLQVLEKALKEELQQIIATGLSEEQLQKFKMQFLAGLEYIKDSLLAGADHLIAPLIQQVPLANIEKGPQEVEAVTLDQVNQALRQYFNPPHYVQGELYPAAMAKAEEEQPQATQATTPKENALNKEIAVKEALAAPTKEEPEKNKPLSTEKSAAKNQVPAQGAPEALKKNQGPDQKKNPGPSQAKKSDTHDT
jgi:Predicted Zn-dependent peptidases